MMYLKGCQKEATRRISKLRKTWLCCESLPDFIQGKVKSSREEKGSSVLQTEQGNAMATSYMISGLKYRCEFDSRGDCLLVNYSDRRIRFLREEISHQKLKHILYQLTYSESNCGCQEATSEAARDAGWTAAACSSRGLALGGQAEQRGGGRRGGPSASPQQARTVTPSAPVPGIITVI